jgi:NADH-quinone oxidoreductase subunit J
MDVPALDPDGNPIDESVPRVLRIRGQEAGTAEYRADTYRRAVTAVLAERGAAVTDGEVDAALGTVEDDPRPAAAPPGTTTGPTADIDLGGGSTRTETER